MRKYFLNAIVIVCAVAAAAFVPAKKKTVDPYPYYFSYDANTEGGQLTPSNYTWLPSGPGSVECTPGELHCVINADKDAWDLPILVSGPDEVFIEKSTKEEETH